jgi:hypothetical protein
VATARSRVITTGSNSGWAYGTSSDRFAAVSLPRWDFGSGRGTIFRLRPSGEIARRLAGRRGEDGLGLGSERRWKRRDATVNWTSGVGIERCRNQWPGPLDRGIGAPTGDRQENLSFPTDKSGGFPDQSGTIARPSPSALRPVQAGLETACPDPRGTGVLETPRGVSQGRSFYAVDR